MLLAFPGTQRTEPSLFGQQQLVASTGHDPTLAFHLLRSLNTKEE